MTIKIINSKAINSGGDGFKIDSNAKFVGDNLQSIGSKGSGFNIVTPIPNTKISLSQEDMETIKEIMKTNPESRWSERLQSIKGIIDLGADAAAYIPAIIAFVRSQVGL